MRKVLPERPRIDGSVTFDNPLEHPDVTVIFGPPGTGKTTTLIDMVGTEIAGGVDPKRIGYFSFTNSATEVARDRILKDSDSVNSVKDFSGFRTLHSLAYRCLGQKVKIISTAQSKAFSKEMDEKTVFLKFNDPLSITSRTTHAVIDAASTARNMMVSFKDYLDYPYNSSSTRLKRWLRYDPMGARQKLTDTDKIRIIEFYNKYENYKKKNGVIDYTSLLEMALEESATIPEFEVVFIDEAQDLTLLQWNFVRRLIKKAKRVYIAGDDDQAICESMGAEPQFMLSSNYKREVLDKSHRVPLAVLTEIKKSKGVLVRLDEQRDRIEKNWEAKAYDGFEGLFRVVSNSFIFELTKKYSNRDWLIIAPTHETISAYSKVLIANKIPHFLSNEIKNPLPDITLQPGIRLATIWGAKGGEADICVLLCDGDLDKGMLMDARLLYVAMTRAKKIHFNVGIEIPILPNVRGTLTKDEKKLLKEREYHASPEGMREVEELLEKHCPIVESKKLDFPEKSLPQDEKFLTWWRTVNEEKIANPEFESNAAYLEEVYIKDDALCLRMSDNTRRRNKFCANIDLSIEVLRRYEGTKTKIYTESFNPDTFPYQKWFKWVYFLEDEQN